MHTPPVLISEATMSNVTVLDTSEPSDLDMTQSAAPYPISFQVHAYMYTTSTLIRRVNLVQRQLSWKQIARLKHIAMKQAAITILLLWYYDYCKTKCYYPPDLQVSLTGFLLLEIVLGLSSNLTVLVLYCMKQNLITSVSNIVTMNLHVLDVLVSVSLWCFH